MIRKALKITAAVLGGLVLILLAWKFTADFRYFSSYDPKAPFNVQVTETVDQGEYQRVKLSFDGQPGEPVPTFMTFPKNMKGKVPCVIFLHGIGQNKKFLDEITTPFNQAGFAMASFDQYMQGERKIPRDKWLKAAVAFRQRPWKTINETRRLIDYLQTHPDIDGQRIYLVGASYGAITGSTVAAFDHRLRAAVLVYGGGDIGKLLDAPLIQNGFKENAPAWLFAPAKAVANFILWPADPIRYVDGIAPTPVLFQNGRNDQLVAAPAAEALQNAAREPKKITWYDSDHIGLDKEVVLKVLEEDLNWLLEQDKPFRKDPPAEIKPAA